MGFQTKSALIPFIFVPLLGCAEQRPPHVEPIPDITEIGQAFDPRATGTVRGEVVWQGPLPEVPPFVYRPKPQSPTADRQPFPNPNAPLVNPSSHGVGNAVVFLRSVDRKRSRPWDHAGVFVALSGKRLRLEQGNEDVRAAYARRGEAITLKSADERLYIVRAGGAAFFSLTFAEPHRPRQRRLEQKGLVELSSAAGHFWQHGYVFVDDHPYYARTDERGRFVLPSVPEGDYQVVSWVPSWKVKEHERDPETSLIRFVTFAPALEREQTVNVLPGSEPTLYFRIDAGMFPQ